MNDNPFIYCDESARRLSRMWIGLKITATTEQKDAVGRAYIAYVLNLGEEVAQYFSIGNLDASYQVGMRQGNARPYAPDLRAFWEKIQKIFPNLHTPQDILFLVKKCGILGASQFLSHIDSCSLPPCHGAWSFVLRNLHTNAIAYK